MIKIFQNFILIYKRKNKQKMKKLKDFKSFVNESSYYYEEKNVKELIGKILVSVDVKDEDREIWFTCDNGDQYVMYHEQDCCETVEVEDIVGDLDDILNSPILKASEDSQEDPDAEESASWTFYNIATIKGHLTIRWYGTSNGYYSEKANFAKVNQGGNPIYN